MGELKSADAVNVRNSYIETYSQIINDVTNNFAQMDFRNADKRKEMEDCIDEIVQECSNMINLLNAMTFE